MSRPPVADQIQVNFRMPADLRNRIKVAAEANNRSMNAEIVAALEGKFPDDRDLAGVKYALSSLNLALYDEELDRNALRQWIEEAEEDLEAFTRRLIRGDRGGLL